MDSITILNYILFLIVIYLVHFLINQFKYSKTTIPMKHPETIVYKTYTPKELSVYNGKDNEKIYLAVKGIVFDVSSGKSFYGPGSMYENFAGRDASRGLAKNSFDLSNITPLNEPIDALNNLNEQEIQSLNEWFQFFNNKYEKIGKLVEYIEKEE